MMEAVRSSETLVNFYQIAWRNNPEDSHLQTEWLVAKKRNILSVKIKVNVIKETVSGRKKADVYFK
jgi:hypothetical protein